MDATNLDRSPSTFTAESDTRRLCATPQSSNDSDDKSLTIRSGCIIRSQRSIANGAVCRLSSIGRRSISKKYITVYKLHIMMLFSPLPSSVGCHHSRSGRVRRLQPLCLVAWTSALRVDNLRSSLILLLVRLLSDEERSESHCQRCQDRQRPRTPPLLLSSSSSFSSSPRRPLTLHRPLLFLSLPLVTRLVVLLSLFFYNIYIYILLYQCGREGG